MSNVHSIPAAFGVNRYLWQKLQDMSVLDPANYVPAGQTNSLMPILPTQEEPTFIQAMEVQPGIGAFPYLVYAWNSQGYGTSYWQSTDQIVYIINAHDQKKLRDIVMVMTGLFKRFDESAAEINKYIQTSTTPDPDNVGQTLPLFGPDYKAFNYKYTSVQGINANISRTDENMPYKAMVTIRVNYTNAYDEMPIADLFQN